MSIALRPRGKTGRNTIPQAESSSEGGRELTGSRDGVGPAIFSIEYRRWATGLVSTYTVVVGVASAWAGEPRRSAIMAASFLPLALLGVSWATEASSRIEGILRRIWRLYAFAMIFATAGAGIYAIAFGMEIRPVALAGIPVVVAGIAIFARIYALAVRLFRGSSENLLELFDFATVAFSSTAVLMYGAAEPLVRQGEASKLHIALLPAFSAVFIFAILYIVTAPSSRPKTPEFVFLTAGCFLFAGTIVEATVLVLGRSGSEPFWLRALRSAALLTGLGLLSVAPLHAVRVPGGSETEFRGPWQPPRFFLPYWSLLALVVLAAATVIDGRRSSVIYGFSAFAGATALVVIRQLLTIRENYRLFQSLSAADERRLAFLRELLKGVEEERIRVANSIESGPVQQLTALMLRSERASTRETSRPHMLIEALNRQLGAAVSELRDLTRSLRPRLTQARGLAEAIEIEAREAFTPGSVALELHIEEVSGLSPDQELHLFRIAEEAIDNVRMHAGASKVRVAFRPEPGIRPDTRLVVLEIQDDGKGFVERLVHRGSRGVVARTGISSMRERADMLEADFQLVSTPGAGTLVRVVMELEREADRSTGEEIR